MINKFIQKKVMILGGYGTFGSIISKRLAKEQNIKVIIGGRSQENFNKFIKTHEQDTKNPIEFYKLDISKSQFKDFEEIKPDMVINAIGPYNDENLKIAEECLKYGINYLDLADKYEFIQKITTMNEKAKEKNIIMISGASSVPSISSAIVDQYKSKFQKLLELEYSISTASNPVPGVSTLKSVLGDVGKEFETIYKGKSTKFYGWNNLKLKKYPIIGTRLLSDFPIPDNVYFPSHYKDLETLRFYAGLGNPVYHILVYMLSLIVKIGIIKNIEKYSDLFYFLATKLNFFSTSKSAFHMQMKGVDLNGSLKSITFYFTTQGGDGIYIPALPSIILAKSILNGKINTVGAYNSIGFLNLEMILEEMKGLKIKHFLQE